MGHAWCKERTSKAQDSKSPLDRVFVRCAHRIYPSLKEEGSVLGGATQRVTSSEIGYAGSPPREVLARGRSIDSVDRPFHPSDWVDVNLEVPSTPRTSSVVTNLTADTSLQPATSPTSSCSNLKDVTPVPPPRRRKRNRGRPLPPKPDETPENSGRNLRRPDHTEEPLYSSVKSPKTSGDEQEEEARADKSRSAHEDSWQEARRGAKEIYEHKVNGTGKVISREVVSGKRNSWSEDGKSWRGSESNHQQRKVHENEEYERFVKNQSVKDSSTPNLQGRKKSKELEKQIEDSSEDAPKDVSQDASTNVESPEGNMRPKNYSTVSLPNYNELEVARHSNKRSSNGEEEANEKPKPRRPVRCSTVSLPAENCLSPFSEKTSVRLEDYIPRRGSTENVSAYQVLEKLDCTENGVVDGGFVKYDPSKLEDWDFSDISNCELNHQRRLSYEHPSLTDSIDEKAARSSVDVVDFVQNAETGESERKHLLREEISDRYVTGSPVGLLKPEAFGKASVAVLEDNEREDGNRISARNGPNLRYFDPPTMANTCGNSSACTVAESPISREPFYLDEEKQRSITDTIGGGSSRNGAITKEFDRFEQSRMIFGRSLSNESEPYDEAYESKELRGHSIVTSKLIKTISEESLPREMLEVADRELDGFFDEKLGKDVDNTMKKDVMEPRDTANTPPPSPEPKIKAEILDNDHSTLLKVLKEEAAEESNLSSMTPSLTELEAVLSDMLEKEESQEELVRHEDRADEVKSSRHSSRCTDKYVEPEITPVEKNFDSCTDDLKDVIHGKQTIEIEDRLDDRTLVDRDSREQVEEACASLGQIFEDRKPLVKGRKVSFCAWEESRMAEIDFKNDPEFIGRAKDLDKNDISVQNEDRTVAGNMDQGGMPSSSASTEDRKSLAESAACTVDLPPEKPSRLHRNLEELVEHTENVPTPPRRKNKGCLGFPKKEIDTTQNGSITAIDPCPNDRLI